MALKDRLTKCRTRDCPNRRLLESVVCLACWRRVPAVLRRRIARLTGRPEMGALYQASVSSAIGYAERALEANRGGVRVI